MSFFITEGQDDSTLVAGQLTLEQVIEIWGDELIEQLGHSLDKERLGDSKLKQSLKYLIQQEGDAIKFRLFFPDYGNFLDEGVAGVGQGGKLRKGQKKLNRKWSVHTPDSRFKFRNKRPPVDMLRKWAGEKGINKWYLQEVIYRKGIKKREWFKRIIDQNPFSKLATSIEVNMSRTIELEVVKMFEKKDSSQGTQNIN